MSPDKPACACKHSAAVHEVEGLEPQCTAPGCICIKYRVPGPAKDPRRLLAHTPFTPAPAAQPVRLVEKSPGLASGPTIEQLIAAGKRSDSQRICNLAARIEEMASDLRSKLEREREAAAAREEIAALEAKLAAARAKLARPKKTDQKSPRKVSAPGDHECPECHQTFATPQGAGSHRARAHGYRRAAS